MWIKILTDRHRTACQFERCNPQGKAKNKIKVIILRGKGCTKKKIGKDRSLRGPAKMLCTSETVGYT